jgi:sugar lactone lactonase YvrE
MPFFFPLRSKLILVLSCSLLLSACSDSRHEISPNANKVLAGAPEAQQITLNFPRENYSIERRGDRFAVIDNVSGSAEILVNLDSTIIFSDYTLNLSVAEKSSSIPNERLRQLAELYVAFFNRIPDADGMAYWIGQIRNGMSNDQLANQFYNAAILYSEQTGYSKDMTNADFVKTIYKNVLGRSGPSAPGDDEVNYWVKELESGKTKSFLVLTMLNSAHTFKGDATWGWVPQLLENKVNVGLLFSVQQGLNFKTPEESITRGNAIASLIEAGDTSKALSQVKVRDIDFDLTASVTLLPQSTKVKAGAEAIEIKTSRKGTGVITWSLSNEALGSLDQINGDQVYFTPAASIADDLNVTITARLGGASSSTQILIQRGAGISLLAGLALEGAIDGSAETARLLGPAGIAHDAQDNVFFVDGGTLVRKLSADGSVTTIAGIAESFGSVDGNGRFAKFNGLRGIAIDRTGNIYVTEKVNKTIRKITPNGIVTTFAGKAGESGFVDGIGVNARFMQPIGIAIDSNGDIWVADMGDTTIGVNGKIRRINAAGFVQTINVSGTAPVAPAGIAIATDGSIVVSDTDSSNVFTLRGSGTTYTSTKNFDLLNVAQAGTEVGYLSDYPVLGFNNVGKLMVVDSYTNRIFSTNSPWSGAFREVGHFKDGTLATAMFNFPAGFTQVSNGDIYISDLDNKMVRRISGNLVSTVVGKPTYGASDGIGKNASFYLPFGLASDGNGKIIVADANNNVIRIIDSNGMVETIAGLPTEFGFTDGLKSTARFNSPRALTVDKNGNIYVSDTYNNLIKKVTSAGQVTTYAGALSTDVYHNGIHSNPSVDGAARDARFFSPRGITGDSKGNLYVADFYHRTIRKISPDGTVSTFAGSPNLAGTTDGRGSIARFMRPVGMTIDSNDNLYVADCYAHNIRKISPNGDVTTFAGVAQSAGDDNGALTSAKFNCPRGLTFDEQGNLYVADSNNDRVRMISSRGTVSTLIGSTSTLNGSTKIRLGPLPGYIGTPNDLVYIGKNTLAVSAGHAIYRVVLP